MSDSILNQKSRRRSPNLKLGFTKSDKFVSLSLEMELARESQSTALFSGIIEEVRSAREDSIWADTSKFHESQIHQITEITQPNQPYLYIPSFSEVRKHTTLRSPRSFSVRARTLRSSSIPNIVERSQSPKSPAPVKDLLPPKVVRPPPIDFTDDPQNKWTLKCVCNFHSGEGLLLFCESCRTWQHAICMGYNSHTVPENYLCDICAGRLIRCKCNNNLNFRFATIRCSSCRFFVHKRCEGIGFGMMPSGEFLCHLCGRSHFHYDKPTLPHTLSLDGDPATFSAARIEQLPPSVTSGPFGSFLSYDMSGATLTPREFCEQLYDRFRSFFFLCHPLYSTSLSKKKRHFLLQSFLTASEYLCQRIYSMTKEKFTAVFDALIVADIYQPFLFINRPDDCSSGCELTENTNIDIPQASASYPKFIQMPKEASLSECDGSLCTTTDLLPDQFICLTEGLIGDLEEFDTSTKVNEAYYQISGTRFVLDTSRIQSNPLHKIKRSMHGNCSLKLFQVGSSYYCGLFAIGNELNDFGICEVQSGIKAGTALAYGIDFLPAIMDDLSKWFSWHCSEPEEDRKENEYKAAAKQKVKKEKTENDIKDKAKKRGRKAKKKSELLNELGITLFSLLDSDSTGELMFRVGATEELSKITTSEESYATTSSVHSTEEEREAVCMEPGLEKLLAVEEAQSGLDTVSLCDHVNEMRAILQ